VKVALFGGAFDPPHLAHRAVVEAVHDELGIDRVIVLPSGNHPFKGEKHFAPADARLAMCRLAFVDLPWVEVSDHEARSTEVGYSIDTVRAFREVWGDAADLFFLIGSDNLRDLPRWRNWRELLGLAKFVIVPRPGFPADDAALAALDLPEDERAALRSRVVPMPPSPLSSTEVRRRLAAGEDVRDCLHPAVLREIERRKLYRP